LRDFEALVQTFTMLIDDFTNDGLHSKLGTRWRGVSDQVMGGVYQAFISQSVIDGRASLRMTGDVCLENDGGFIQVVFDLALSGDAIDASQVTGTRITVLGYDEKYSIHLRTLDNVRPWQSYWANFIASRDWRTIDLTFETFVPYHLEAALDTARLRRIGLVAIGRTFYADLAVSGLAFYR
jgi:hypothetical protein